LEFSGKIFSALIHVDSDSDDSQVWRVVLRPHLHKYACYFAPINLNIVGQLDRGFETGLGANHVRDRFDRPNRKPPRVAELDLGTQQD
jgi:hypothetical protein